MKKLWLLLFLFACTNDGIPTVDASQVAQMRQTDPNVQLVDVRTPEEVQASGHIEGAVNIDIESDDFEARLAGLDKEKPVIVHCRTGGRSTKAARIMQKLGFKQVLNYKGGMNDWLSKGNKTVR